MRSVNLMPPDERRDGRAPMRAGAASYVLLAALGLGLLMVIATALTGKQVSDRESEKSELTAELADVTAQAEALRPFSEFRAMQEARTATVTSLAESRFDWERVMRELSLVIGDDVWLTSMTGTVTPGVEVGEGTAVALRSTVAGPALELVGCVTSENALAGFITALEDIDGVTRVGLQSSELSTTQGQQSQPATSGGGGDECRTRDFISKFELVVAFDAVPIPATASAAPGVPAPLAPQGEGEQLAEQPAAPGTDSTATATATGAEAGGG